MNRIFYMSKKPIKTLLTQNDYCLLLDNIAGYKKIVYEQQLKKGLYNNIDPLYIKIQKMYESEYNVKKYTKLNK